MHLTVAESSAVVADLRRARRTQRVARIHWVDALYQVYITGLVSMAVIVLIAQAVGDDPLDAAAVADVVRVGPAAAGLLVALALFAGLRSGSRGGPLALERPDVRHVLLSPVDRGVALRGPAWRQVRFLLAVGAAVGAAAGLLAAQRLPEHVIVWVACGAAFGVSVTAIAYGAALLASGTGLPSWAATLAGGALVAWSVADLVGRAPTAPTSLAGSLALWPLDLDPVGVVAPLLGLVLVLVGMRFVAGTSLEAAERRTALVGQMRFAVTLQDLRTVLVLRRQLAQEHPRSRPWIPASGRTPRYPVWHRGLRSVLRWPASRLARIAIVAVVAGLSFRGVWAGTTPLIVLAGFALWVAALDAAEPLGQEVDHPGRTDTFPFPRGELFLQHVPIALVASCVVGLLAALVAAAPLGASVPVGPAFVVGLAAGALAAAGAVVSVVQGAPDPTDTLAMVTPEIAGTRTVFRTAFPPALAVLGTVPLLAARAAERGISEPPPTQAALLVTLALSVVVVLVCGWTRFRDDMRRAMAEAAESMSPTKTLERQREERLAEEEREAEALAESRRLAGLPDDAGGSAQARAKARAKAKGTKTAAPAPAPPGVQGGSSAKPIGRKRDQT